MTEGSKPVVKPVILTLAYMPVEGTLNISGEVPNVDMAINICQQALRELDTKLRQQKALEFQQELSKQADSRRIAEMLTKRIT